MYNQVGTAKFDEEGIIKKGVIIRHLVLPNHIQNSKNILKWIKENMPEDVYVSAMAQYFPTYKAKKDAYINRKLTKKEYKEIENYLYTLNIEKWYIQELGEHEEEYVPNFDLSEWKQKNLTKNKNVLLFSYKINVSVTDGHFVDCMCIRKYTYFFIIFSLICFINSKKRVP